MALTAPGTPTLALRNASVIVDWAPAQTIAPEPAAPNPLLWSAPVGQRMTMPTHISPPGGQSTHPSVAEVPGGWNGFRYWMAYTPYPNTNDDHEDPNLSVSADGITWRHAPGVTQPLDDADGQPEYNSDTDLVLGPNNTMYLFWRFYDVNATGQEERVYVRTSTDGVTWTPKALVWQYAQTALRPLSPSFTWDGTRWTVWFVNITGGTRLMRMQTTGAALSGWSTPVAATISGAPGNYFPWHVSIKRYGDSWLGMLNMTPVAANGRDGILVMITSTDGLAWTAANKTFIPRLNGTAHNALYRADFIPETVNGIAGLRTYYSAYYRSPQGVDTWNIYRTFTGPSSVEEIAVEPVGGITYRVYRGEDIVGTTSATNYVDVGPARGVSLTYRIEAVDPLGNTAMSGSRSITVPQPPAAPVSPRFSPGTTPEVRILGTGTFHGQASFIGSYTVEEDATPLSLVSSGGGGVGSISFSATADDGIKGTPALRNQTFELYDPEAGVQRGTVDAISIRDGELNVQGISSLLPLVARKTAANFTGTLYGAFLYYFSLGGVDQGIVVENGAEAIVNKPVNLPSWTSEVWGQIRRLATIHQLEISAIAGTYVLRKRGARMITPRDVIEEDWDFGNGTAAHIVAIEYQAKRWGAGERVFPLADEEITDRAIITVDAGETLTTNYPVNAHLATVEQPVHILNLDPALGEATSSYSVVDKEGRNIHPRDWANMGGKVEVAIGDDGRSIDVTVTAPATGQFAPYRIAGTSSDLEWQYGALLVRGTGILFEDREIWSATGASLDLAPADEVVRINEPLIDTDEAAYAALSAAVLERAGYRATLRVTTTAVNRRGETGIPVYVTFDQFDAMFTGTFDQFDAEYTGTFDDFDARLSKETSSDFANQAYGGVGGARIPYRDAIYRVDSASITETSYSMSASENTTFDDFDDVWAGATFDDFEAFWGDVAFETFEVSPLAR